MALTYETVNNSVAGFLNWWAGTLREVAYDVRRKLGIAAPTRWTFYVSPTRCTLTMTTRRSKTIGFDYASGIQDTDLSALRDAMSPVLGPETTVDVAIAEELTWSTSLTFPLAAKRKLRQAAMYRLDKESPLRVDRVSFAVGEVREQHGKLIADIVLVRNVIVEYVIDALHAVKARAGCVYLIKNGTTLRLPVSPSLFQWTVWRGTRLGLTVMGIGLMALSTSVYSTRVDREIERMSDAVQAERLLFQDSLQTMEENRARNRILIDLQSIFVAPSAADVLSAVTAQLPDDVWLVEFRLSETQLELEGYAERPPSVAMLLQESPLIANATLLWTRPGEQQGASQRFRLIATVQFYR